MDARDEQAVTSRLADMGYSARAIYPAGMSGATQKVAVQQAPAVAASAPRAVPAGAPVSVKSCVPAGTLAAFFRQVATLVTSGVPLYQSFVDLQAVTRNRRLKMALGEMQQSLQSGGKLSSALAKYPHIFPVWATASVWAGELNGNVDRALEEVATEIEREASDTRFGWIGWGLTKLTTVVLIATFPLFLGFGKFLTAGMTSQNTTEAQDKMVRLLVSLLLSALPFAIVSIVSFMAWGRAKHVPAVRRTLDGLIVHVPLWGKLHRYRANARFLHVLDTLYAAGISPSQAWEAASLTVRNNEIASRLTRTRAEGPNVERVADMLQIAGTFEGEDIGMAMAGEKAGRLPEALGNLAATYEDKANGLKTWGRIVSVHAVIMTQLLIGAALVVMMAVSYRQFLEPLFDNIGQ